MPWPLLAGAFTFRKLFLVEEVTATKSDDIDLTGRIGLRPHEFAAAIGVKPRTVYASIDRGELEAERVGRCFIIPMKVVNKFLGRDNNN